MCASQQEKQKSDIVLLIEIKVQRKNYDKERVKAENVSPMLRKSFNLCITSAEVPWNTHFESIWATRRCMLHSSALLLQSLTRQAILCFLWYWTYCAAPHKSPVTSALLSIWISFSFPAHSLSKTQGIRMSLGLWFCSSKTARETSPYFFLTLHRARRKGA